MFDLRKMGLDLDPIANVFSMILMQLKRIADALERIANEYVPDTDSRTNERNENDQ